ncbi:thioredoxin-like protein [Lipomyces oligophaga]|uniref:thioredoxin-like protein n=1 Tax=Lipomyces oligophaga TaxID=45792 RepID=UPI0034CE63F2
MASKYAFPATLKELRFHLCQTGEKSSPLRTFLTKSYPVMKKHNPYIPILIRESQGVSPVVYARHEFGKESKLVLDGISESELTPVLEKFIMTK